MKTKKLFLFLVYVCVCFIYAQVYLIKTICCVCVKIRIILEFNPEYVYGMVEFLVSQLKRKA